jgi:2-C-methyl-D-erythritol 2,4-cyclodiphosphate synthase
MIPDIRVGFGFDVHPMRDGRALWLGGVHIASERGLDGHSDADVLIHAICDALLGAAGLPDIGHYFPNTSEEWKGADSKILLKEVVRLIGLDGWKVVNIDSSLVMEAPKIKPHLSEMKRTLADCMHIDIARVGIKATTNEKLGYVGAFEGADAYAVALICKI